MLPLKLIIDGVDTQPNAVFTPLIRAVIISLFTWRRAEKDDALPSINKFGWWGDTYPTEINDRIGSRLWLLGRAKLTDENVTRAREYAEEALQWLIDDGVAADVQVQSERQALDRLAVGITLIRGDKSALNIRFINVWDYINAI